MVEEVRHTLSFQSVDSSQTNCQRSIYVAVPVFAALVASQVLEVEPVTFSLKFFLLHSINRFLQKLPAQVFLVSFLL